MRQIFGGMAIGVCIVTFLLVVFVDKELSNKFVFCYGMIAVTFALLSIAAAIHEKN